MKIGSMEHWELDFEWLRVRHYVKKVMDRQNLPDLQTILFLIGIQELGQVNREFSKEEKQDLMHIAVCTLLESEGYYEFVGRDEDGWPHWNQKKRNDIKGTDAQENLLKSKIIQYFSAVQSN